MSKPSKPPPIRLPSLEQDKRIKAAVGSDPDAQPLSAKQMKTMTPMRSVLGRSKSESRKLLVSVRYSPEVISFFKSTGECWQSRMDAVLRKHVTRQSGNA